MSDAHPPSKKLSRCLHCGATDGGGVVHIELSKFDGYAGSRYVVCDFKIGGCGASSGFRATEDDAVLAWNRRWQPGVHDVEEFYRE